MFNEFLPKGPLGNSDKKQNWSSCREGDNQSMYSQPLTPGLWGYWGSSEHSDFRDRVTGEESPQLSWAGTSGVIRARQPLSSLS